MSDWQVGDLAVCVGSGKWSCEGYGAPRTGAPSLNETCRVSGVEVDDEGVWLELHEYPEGQWHAPKFRKIRPDEHEACEEEFRILLKLSKHRVSA